MEEEWETVTKIAEAEYEQVATLCNLQSSLSKAVDIVQRDVTHAAAPDRRMASLQGSDLKAFEMYNQLDLYHQQIDKVRKTHSSIKAKLAFMKGVPSVTVREDLPSSEHARPDSILPRRRQRDSPRALALAKHVEMSERVICTIMRVSNNTSGPCGVLFENGLVRTASVTADHEANVVALAALRASAARLKSS
mmetsp:Transcript_1492/g.3563  ORF Transcript_1492/g.3563 Transcript_1492/m.3563 type:complete len:193 (-) Transcript_1492:725-1303(-)